MSMSFAPVDELRLAGFDAANFRLQANGCSRQTLGNEASCVFEVAFDPMFVAAKSAVVEAEIGTGVVRRMTVLSGEAVHRDSDSDGLPDECEEEQDLDPYEPSDARSENDVDGVDKTIEFRASSDPNDAQSTPATLRLLLSLENVIVPESGRATVGIKLSHQPEIPVRVDVRHSGGDGDISVTDGGVFSSRRRVGAATSRSRSGRETTRMHRTVWPRSPPAPHGCNPYPLQPPSGTRCRCRAVHSIQGAE